MMRNSWTLKERLYSCERAVSKKKEKDDNNEMKKEELKGDEYIVSPYLR